MSDYGDDYSDYGDDWFFVEDGYAAADELAEHVIPSPPPTTYGDDDDQEEWDRFDYFNDLEYASDGYDDATFAPHDALGAKIGQKRKHTGSSRRTKKKQRTADGEGGAVIPCAPAHAPVVWRAQSDRRPKQRLLADNAPSYALLKNWREALPSTPEWARGSPPPAESHSPADDDLLGALTSELLQTTSEPLDDDAEVDVEDVDDGEGGIELSQDALMAALQRQLAAAGGPLAGMDPQQLLQFAMRMATDKDAGDDIAGEMADAMLEGDEEDEEADTQEGLLSWVAQQRNANKDAAATEPKSPEASRDDNRPPTPPSSEANRSVKVTETHTKSNGTKSKTWTAQETKPATTLKRKAEDAEDVEGPSKTTKKRATRSFDAPTAASQAKAAPTRTTRSTRSKR